MSAAEVHIQPDILSFGGYKIWILEDRNGPDPRLITFDGRRVPYKPNSNQDPDDYFCLLPREAAHALLGALARELGAVEHPEQLRKDFQHLRDRHDKLVDNLMTMFDGAALAERIRRGR